MEGDPFMAFDEPLDEPSEELREMCLYRIRIRFKPDGRTKKRPNDLVYFDPDDRHISEWLDAGYIERVAEWEETGWPVTVPAEEAGEEIQDAVQE